MSKKSSTFAVAFGISVMKLRNIYRRAAHMVVIAQLAEHRIVVPSVVGSSPTIHPKKSGIPLGISLFFCD